MLLRTKPEGFNLPRHAATTTLVVLWGNKEWMNRRETKQGIEGKRKRGCGRLSDRTPPVDAGLLIGHRKKIPDRSCLLEMDGRKALLEHRLLIWNAWQGSKGTVIAGDLARRWKQTGRVGRPLDIEGGYTGWVLWASWLEVRWWLAAAQ